MSFSADDNAAPYSLSDMKEKSDTALGKYLCSVGVRQSHVREDIRLGLGLTLLAIGAGTFGAEFKLGQDAIQPWVLFLVGPYFVLNALYSLWTWLVCADVVFEGVDKAGRKIKICSKSNPYDPTYELTVTTSTSSLTTTATKAKKPAAGSKRLAEQEEKLEELEKDEPETVKGTSARSSISTRTIKGSFTRWFRADGTFENLAFQQWLVSEGPALMGPLDKREFYKLEPGSKPPQTDEIVVEEL